MIFVQEILTNFAGQRARDRGARLCFNKFEKTNNQS